jgi:hypothetical protein
LSIVSVPWADALGFEETRDGDGPPRCDVDGVVLAGRRLRYTAFRIGTLRGILGNDVLRDFPFVLDGPGRRILLPASHD